MSKCALSREDFCEYIRKIEELDHRQEKLNDTLQELDDDNMSWCFIYSTPIRIIQSLLEKVMNDCKGGWISYYCWELDFGRDYTEGCVENEDGVPVPLSTPDDLYNILISE